MGFAGTSLGELRGPTVTANEAIYHSPAEKQSPTVSRSRGLPEQSAPKGRVGQAVPQAGGEPFRENPPSTPETLPFHPEAQGQLYPRKAWEEVGKKIPDHSILVFVL